MFPKGNDIQRNSDYIAVHLDFPEAAFTPVQVCPRARFELTAVNQTTDSQSLRRGLSS